MAVATRVDIDAITVKARAIPPGRTVLLILATVLMGVGWCAAMAWRVLRIVLNATWIAISWSCVAVAEGFRQGMAGAGASG